MPATYEPGNDPRLTATLAATGPVLLDFDGPVTPIFAKGRNHRAADAMRQVLAQHGGELPPSVRATLDPLEVLHFAGRQADAGVLALVEDTLRNAEVRFAHDAPLTTGADAFLTACAETRRPVVVVSNNAAEAIEAFLTRTRLRGYVGHIVGRPHSRPDLMKPKPAIVEQALAHLAVVPARCVLVGDSVTDVEVAHLTGVRSIGYVKAPNRLAALEHAGADATVDSMTKLAAAVRTVPAHTS